MDEKQLIRARNAGATVILLIVAALSEARLQELFDFATHLGLEVLVETHNLTELGSLTGLELRSSGSIIATW